MIDRYDPAVIVDGLEVEVVMEDHQRGDYVKFDDHENLYDDLQRSYDVIAIENAGLNEETERLKQLLEEV